MDNQTEIDGSQVVIQSEKTFGRMTTSPTTTACTPSCSSESPDESTVNPVQVSSIADNDVKAAKYDIPSSTDKDVSKSNNSTETNTNNIPSIESDNDVANVEKYDFAALRSKLKQQSESGYRGETSHGKPVDNVVKQFDFSALRSKAKQQSESGYRDETSHVKPVENVVKQFDFSALRSKVKQQSESGYKDEASHGKSVDVVKQFDFSSLRSKLEQKAGSDSPGGAGSGILSLDEHNKKQRDKKLDDRMKKDEAEKILHDHKIGGGTGTAGSPSTVSDRHGLDDSNSDARSNSEAGSNAEYSHDGDGQEKSSSMVFENPQEPMEKVDPNLNVSSPEPTLDSLGPVSDKKEDKDDEKGTKEQIEGHDKDTEGESVKDANFEEQETDGAGTEEFIPCPSKTKEDDLLEEPNKSQEGALSQNYDRAKSYVYDASEIPERLHLLAPPDRSYQKLFTLCKWC